MNRERADDIHGSFSDILNFLVDIFGSFDILSFLAGKLGTFENRYGEFADIQGSFAVYYDKCAKGLMGLLYRSLLQILRALLQICWAMLQMFLALSRICRPLLQSIMTNVHKLRLVCCTDLFCGYVGLFCGYIRLFCRYVGLFCGDTRSVAQVSFCRDGSLLAEMYVSSAGFFWPREVSSAGLF